MFDLACSSAMLLSMAPRSLWMRKKSMKVGAEMDMATNLEHDGAFVFPGLWGETFVKHRRAKEVGKERKTLKSGVSQRDVVYAL